MTGELRSQLRETAPDLYEALDNCWEIAFNEWLPALGAQLDSYNSYPHLRNLEYYLDQIVRGMEQRIGNNSNRLLRPAEIFVLLASVLFHDIGRLFGGNGHGESSYAIIIRHAADVGIHSPELARTIARICFSHDLSPSDYPVFEKELSNVVIDPHGEIREQALAALLTLADHLDGTHLRVLPFYVRSARSTQVVGAFREVVRGVQVDHDGELVRIVLGDAFSESSDNDKNAENNVHYDWTPRLAKRLAECDEGLFKDVKQQVERKNVSNAKEIQGLAPQILEAIGMSSNARDHAQPALAENLLDRNLEDWHHLLSLGLMRVSAIQSTHGNVEENLEHELELRGPKSEPRAPIAAMRWNALTTFARQPPPAQATSLNFAEISRALRRLTAEELQRPESLLALQGYGPSDTRKITWPKGILLAILLGDVRANGRALAAIRNSLSAFGLPLGAWVLEHHERLYNFEGKETYEPLFSRDYLHAVARGMARLAAEVFPHGPFSYEALASEVRDPDLIKVKRAVRRLSILLRPVGNRTAPTAIWTSGSHWRLLVASGNMASRSRNSIEDELKKVLDFVGDPDVR